MAKTSIEWTVTISPDGTALPGFSFNAWHGCQHVHEGCRNCWAENNAKRFGFAKWGPTGTRNKTSTEYWEKPLAWNKKAAKDGVRRKVFCNSSSDVFEDWQGPIIDHEGSRMFVCTSGQYAGNIGDFPSGRPATMNDLRRDLFALIDSTPNLDWLLLTKRPENIRRMLVPYSLERVSGHVSQNEGDGKRIVKRNNLWLGTSISDQATADKFVPELLKCRDLSPVLFLSAEPLLGPVNAFDYLRGNSYQQWANGGGPNQCHHGIAAGLRCNDCSHIDWVIVGGESGPHARPCNAEWIDSLVAQCRDAGVPCFVKQLGSNHWGESPECGFARVPLQDSKGGDWDEWPESWRVRQFPNMEGAAK